MAGLPHSGSLDRGAEEACLAGFFSCEPDTHSRQPDTFLGELRFDQPVVRLVRPDPTPAMLGTSSLHGLLVVLRDRVPPSCRTTRTSPVTGVGPHGRRTARSG
jgi:hypothetical protein